jgi:hypothetical protein
VNAKTRSVPPAIANRLPRPKTLAEAFKRGVEFVALNDEPGDLKVSVIRGYISVVALSEAFGYTTTYIAIQVKKVREDMASAEGPAMGHPSEHGG